MVYLGDERMTAVNGDEREEGFTDQRWIIWRCLSCVRSWGMNDADVRLRASRREGGEGYVFDF